VVVQRGVVQLLKDIQRKLENTIIIVTHDMGVQANIADRVGIMYAGRMVEEASTRTIFGAPFTEADWTQTGTPGVTAYTKSKTLAERAAREFMAQDRSGLHYASVNPGLVLGPALDRDIGTSAEIVQMMLRGKYPGAPRMAIPCIDVRDVARMHRLAIEVDAPSGGRYLGCAECLWMIDIARAIRASLGEAARKVPSRVLPDWAVKLAGLFDPTARLAIPELGKELRVDTSLTRRTLGITFIPAPEAAAAMAKSLVDLELA